MLDAQSYEQALSKHVSGLAFGDSGTLQRVSFDLDTYVQRIQERPCFICALVDGQLDGNHVIYQDGRIIPF